MHQIVPKASGVARALHPIVPEPAGGPRAAPSALACPHTGLGCPALTALFGPLAPPEDDARTWLQALAPCAHCRVSFEAGRAGLRHVRLGQREREILLLAAAAGGPVAVTEPGMSRSLSAARRRAALSLGKAGLVAPSDAGPKAAGPPRATVGLTELGRYVLAAYGRFLEAGKPVRWTRPARGAALPGRDPADLLSEALARTEAALRDTLTELKGVLVAAIGGRLKDPDRLDAVTRHLERKATVLKAVLQPTRPART
jgi:hypothetical protein